MDVQDLTDKSLCVQQKAENKCIGVYTIGTDLTPGLVVNIADNPGTIAAIMAEYSIYRNGIGGTIGVIQLWMPRGC